MSHEIIQDTMGFVDEATFAKLIQDIKKQLPPAMKDKLDEAKGDIKSMEDLTSVLNQLFTEFGDTVPRSYMFFTYGSKVHLMIEMDQKLKKMITLIAKQCDFDDKDINDVLYDILTSAQISETSETTNNEIDG